MQIIGLWLNKCGTTSYVIWKQNSGRLKSKVIIICNTNQKYNSNINNYQYRL